MKKIFLFTLILLFALPAFSQQSSERKLIVAAQKALARSFNLKIERTNLSVVKDYGRMVVVSAPTGGMVFMDKQEGHVLGCTPMQYVDGEVLPCGLEYWIKCANSALQSGKSIRRVESEHITDVDPFITTKWSQEKPFFNLCPRAGLKHCMTGCVATAMAQVANYYSYPTQGKGKGSYSVTSGSGSNERTTTYTATINGVYDWENMLDDYSSNSYTNEQITAVATLMRDCGYSVNMAYAKDGSGALSLDIPNGLTTNFGYDSLSIGFMMHDYCTDEQWYDMIYAELAAKRPIIMGGQSNSGGHAFVFDGMNADGLVHINWGWAGQYDGFYDPAVMTSGLDFTQQQTAVFGITPSTASLGKSPLQTDILLLSPQIKIENDSLCFTGSLYNAGWKDYDGDIVFNMENLKNPEESYSLIFLDSTLSLPQYSGWQFEDTPEGQLYLNEYFVEEGEDTLSFKFATGEYEIYFYCQGINEDEAKYVVTEGGVEWRVKIKVDENGHISFDDADAITSPSITPTPSVNNSVITYDLSGRIVSPHRKGITIRNGKKYLQR